MIATNILRLSKSGGDSLSAVVDVELNARRLRRKSKGKPMETHEEPGKGKRWQQVRHVGSPFGWETESFAQFSHTICKWKWSIPLPLLWVCGLGLENLWGFAHQTFSSMEILFVIFDGQQYAWLNPCQPEGHFTDDASAFPLVYHRVEFPDSWLSDWLTEHENWAWSKLITCVETRRSDLIRFWLPVAG